MTDFLTYCKILSICVLKGGSSTTTGTWLFCKYILTQRTVVYGAKYVNDPIIGMISFSLLEYGIYSLHTTMHSLLEIFEQLGNGVPDEE